MTVRRAQTGGADPYEVIITVNSPGEVATWLAPTVRALRAIQPDIKVTVFILPCTFAAGTEADVVRGIPGVDRVVPPRESISYVFGRRARTHPSASRRVLLFLGGEFALAARLARRLGCVAAAYTQGYINSHESFRQVFVPTEEVKGEVRNRGVAEGKIAVVGNLMVDAALETPVDGDAGQDVQGLGLAPNQGVIALFAGSRPLEVRRMLPLVVESALKLSRNESLPQFLLVVSPFVSISLLTESFRELEAQNIRVRVDSSESQSDTFPAYVEHGEDRATILVHRKRSNVIMSRMQLAITIPGSNTAELAVWGVPMVVCIPLDRLADIPLEGVAGLVDRVPLLGKSLKRWAVRRLAERTKFAALPNMKEQRFVVPELRSESLSADDVAQCALSLWRDEAARRRMSAELKQVFGGPGAAGRVAHRVLEMLADS